MTRWIALLRGINVGGGNRLAMADLRDTVHGLGFENARTYIQSGNIVFDDPSGHSEVEVVDRLAAAIADRHRRSIPVVARTAAEMTAIAERHPEREGAIEPKFLHVQFLDRSPDPARVSDVDADAYAYAPDRWLLDGREIYLTYPDGSGRSKLTIEVFERAWGVTATARNLNTVHKLVALGAA